MCITQTPYTWADTAHARSLQHSIFALSGIQYTHNGGESFVVEILLVIVGLWGLLIEKQQYSWVLVLDTEVINILSGGHGSHDPIWGTKGPSIKALVHRG